MIDPNIDPPEGSLQEKIVDAIRTVHDPEIPINLYDLGLIYELQISDACDVHIVMTLTSPNCPVAESLPGMVETVVRAVDGVGAVTLELTWEPVWSAERLSDAARLELEFTGHTGPIGGPRAPYTPLTLGRKDRPAS